jgi:hypothetical protein
MLPGADKGRFSVVERFRTVFSQTRSMVGVSPVHFVVVRRLGDYVGARFGARLTMLWQNSSTTFRLVAPVKFRYICSSKTRRIGTPFCLVLHLYRKADAPVLFNP